MDMMQFQMKFHSDSCLARECLVFGDPETMSLEEAEGLVELVRAFWVCALS